MGGNQQSSGNMGRDAWRSQISQDSGKELRDALEDEGDDLEEGLGAEDDDEEWEQCEGDWDELEKLERAIDGCTEGGGEEGTLTGASQKDEDVVEIRDSEEEQPAANNEWEEVCVDSKVSGSLPAQAQVRKATKQDRLRALHLHHVHLLCLLARGCFLSKQCYGLRLQRRMDRINLSAKLALPSPHSMRAHHVRALLDWLHGNFDVTEQERSSSEKLTDVSLAKALDAGKGSHLAKTLVFISILRHLGLQTRLVCSLQPCPYKLKGVIQLSGGGIRFQRVLPKAGPRKAVSAAAAGSALKRKKQAEEKTETGGHLEPEETGGGKAKKKAKTAGSDKNGAKADARGKILTRRLDLL